MPNKSKTAAQVDAENPEIVAKFDTQEPRNDITAPSNSGSLTDVQATIGGGIAGTLANLATLSVSTESPQLSDIPWLRIVICAILGAATVYFLAERIRRHVFVYGIAAPFVIIGVLKSHEAKVEKQSADIAQIAVGQATAAAAAATENQRRSAENVGLSPRLGAEATQAVVKSEFPSL